MIVCYKNKTIIMVKSTILGKKELPFLFVKYNGPGEEHSETNHGLTHETII